ncbi:hypothetical protein L7F22_064647 [Adiantum nelumboides]|nr:hypothetical protein [Adiantum nelumboides]
MSFAPDTYLGKGRLHELLHFEDKQPKPQFTSIFGVDFDPTTFDMCRQGPEVATAMDAIFDEVCKQLTLSQESLQDVQWPLRMIRTRAADLLRFLNLAMSSLEGQESPSDIRKTAYWLANRIDHLLERLRLGLCESQKRFKGDVFRLQLTLRWAKVELFWRVRALCLDGARDDLRDGLRDGLDEDDDVEGSLDAACRQVMLSLLVHGFHRTMKGYKGACERQRGGSTCGVEETGFRDESAETWVCLIHLLSKCRFNLQDRFWGVFDEAYQQYQALFSAKARSSVGQAEATWFIIYALCALSRFSASIGASSTKSPLEANWSLVGKVVGSVKLRFDDHVESKLSSRALRKRDGYIRIILARILLLAQRAAWKFEGAEAMLAALFQIFESHRLADLPTDEEHDFAPFLYRYDDSALYSIDDTERIGGESAFQTFLCILAWAARDLKQGADAGAGQGGDRMVSRLFSRMTPVRIMDFTRQRPPTNHERSSLFNHYSIAMLNLHLVPSAHVQRFRQIRSFLAFEKADWRSQLACIRAMMYAAVLYQHHNLDVGPVASWFSSILRSLLADFDELQRTRPEPGQSFAYGRRVGEVTNLLKASLRSVQYVIRDPGLRHTCQHEEESRRIRYPDVSLIDPAWTEKLFDSQAIMSADIAREAFACLWRFLEARSEAVHEAAMTSSTVQPAAAQDEDSQDSYAELFDEVDFDDPALARMLDIGTEAMADAAPPTSSQRQEEQDGILVRQKDREFAELIACRISPAIFRFITNSLHPDRIGSRAYVLAGSDDEEDEELEEVTKDDDGEEQRQSLEAAIDVWVSFASVVVASSSGARSWVGYVNFGGKESFKNLSHGIHKREVGLRFLWNVLHLLEQDNELDRFDELSKDMWSIWFASIVARRLSVVLQDFTAMLAKMDVKLFEGSNFRDDGEKSLENFKKTRLDLLLCILENVDKTLANDKDKVVAQRVVGGLSSLLSSLRIYVEEVISSSAEGKGHTRGKDYVDFSGRVLSALERKVANEEVKRGIKTELGRTKAAVQRAQEIV